MFDLFSFKVNRSVKTRRKTDHSSWTTSPTTQTGGQTRRWHFEGVQSDGGHLRPLD